MENVLKVSVFAGMPNFQANIYVLFAKKTAVFMSEQFPRQLLNIEGASNVTQSLLKRIRVFIYIALKMKEKR